MEEILASIRTIIADERDLGKVDAPKTGPQIIYSKDAPAPQRAEEPAQPAEIAAQTAEPQTPKVVWRQSEPASPKSEESPDLGEDGPLVSPETDKAVTSAFEALSAQFAARSAQLAEGMIRDMLRPILKTWLDENLPGIVERLVGAEIERLARGAR